MTKSKWKSLLWTVAAAVLAVSVVFGALSIHNALNASAEGAVTSEMSAGGGSHC